MKRDARSRDSLTPESVGPLSRPVAVDNLPAQGVEATVEATAEECVALAKDFKLPAVRSLVGRYKLTGTPERVRVTGRIAAAVTQVCVVTLEEFDSDLEEDVEVDFSAPDSLPLTAGESEREYEPPDEIVNGHIDLGSLTAEFLALGLDPYPRKPGVDFAYEVKDDPAEGPFAALGKLKQPK
jgi:uncharacterized metal-binding protein YceD (DUF177 family)